MIPLLLRLADWTTPESMVPRSDLQVWYSMAKALAPGLDVRGPCRTKKATVAGAD